MEHDGWDLGRLRELSVENGASNSTRSLNANKLVVESFQLIVITSM